MPQSSIKPASLFSRNLEEFDVDERDLKLKYKNVSINKFKNDNKLTIS